MSPAVDPITPETPEPDFRVERLRDPAIRNLAIGLAVFLVTGLIMAMAAFLSWSHALVALVVAVVAMSILWVLWRLELQRQPYGLFLSLSLVCLAAATIPMTYGMVNFIRLHAPDRPAAPRETAGAATAATAATPPAMAGVLLLVEKYPPPAFDPATDPHARLLADTKVQIAGQAYLARAGETFPLLEQAGADLLIAAGSEAIPLSTAEAEVITPARTAAGSDGAKQPETPEQAAARAAKTRAAQAEAMRLYPALRVLGTRENKAFIDAHARMKESTPEALDDPEWPLQLANALAESQGWKREDR